MFTFMEFKDGDYVSYLNITVLRERIQDTFTIIYDTSGACDRVQ